MDDTQLRIHFEWNGKKYSVAMAAYERELIVLPTRTVLRVTKWNEGHPPTPAIMEEVFLGPHQLTLSAEDLAHRSNAVLAVEENDSQPTITLHEIAKLLAIQVSLDYLQITRPALIRQAEKLFYAGKMPTPISDAVVNYIRNLSETEMTELTFA